MAKWPYGKNMAIKPYGHMASNVADMGVCGKNNKNAVF
jgi:hypothetical protein